MKAKTFYCWAFLLLFNNLGFAQIPYKDALKNYRVNFLPEKVFVHTDKDIYAAGETIWGAVYLVDGQTHKPDAFSTTVHVELVDEQQNILVFIYFNTDFNNTELDVVRYENSYFD